MECTEDEVQSFVDCTNIGIKEPSLNNYHCVCGRLVLIVNELLQKLPLRKTDGARVADSKKHFYKIISDPEPEIVHILRRKGVEKQYRFKCKQCKLPVFYKHDTNSGVTFVLKNAVIGTSLSKVIGNENKKGETQTTKKGTIFRDSKTKISGVYMPSYKENYEVIKLALEKQGKWEKPKAKSCDPCSSK